MQLRSVFDGVAPPFGSKLQHALLGGNCVHANWGDYWLADGVAVSEGQKRGCAGAVRGPAPIRAVGRTTTGRGSPTMRRMAGFLGRRS